MNRLKKWIQKWLGVEPPTFKTTMHVIAWDEASVERWMRANSKIMQRAMRGAKKAK